MKKFFKSSYFAIIMLFLYVPIVVMIIFSFNSGSTVFSFISFSGEWYKEFFNNSPFIKSIITSLFVAIVSTIISLIIGVMAAIGLSRTKKITQKSWFGVANIPLINADVVTAVSLMIVFLLSGMKFGIGTLILAHVSFNVPYVLITVMPRLRKVDKSVVDAAIDLGSKPHQVLFKIILPILKPAIITAAAIAFAMSFDDFIISYFTGGDQTNVSTFIYTAKKVKPFIFAFGTLLVAVIVFVIICWNIVSVVKMKQRQIMEEIKDGWYKSKEINKQYKKLNKYYQVLNNQSTIVKSKNPLVWIKLWYYLLIIKIYSLKNYDKKISRLEWKQYKIRNEIQSEKRYFSRLERTKKSIIKINKELAKAKVDIKKAAKLSIQLERLVERQEFLESEIEWILDRDNKAQEKANKVGKQIKELQLELEREKKSLSKKDIAWYKNKIKKLTEYKIEIEEGKNHYKLRMVTEKLKDTREARNNKIFALNRKLKSVQKDAYQNRELGYWFTFLYKIFNNDIILKNKESFVMSFNNKLEWRIIKTEDNLDKIQTKVNDKREKFFPSNEDDSEGPTKSKNWLQRSWKMIAVILIALAAFSGLTVAYVKNNIYDLTIGNWGEYIDPELITKFEKETGLKINYQVYDSNETLQNKLYTFDYDVMVPSDYMVQRMAEEGKLRKLDWEKLNINNPTSSYSYDSVQKDKYTIDSSLVKLMNESKVNVKWDDNDDGKHTILDYSVPYFWGDLSIVFNTNHNNVKKMLEQEKLNIDNDKHLIGNQTNLGWEIIKKAQEQGMDLALNNDPKNLYLIASEVLFQRENLKSTGEVNKATDYLKSIVKDKNVGLYGDDMLANVTNGNFDIAIMYSGDAVSANTEFMNSGKGSSFVLGRPQKDQQRTNIYSDNMVIGANTVHEDAAYKFINFIYENSVQNSEYVGLASPEETALNTVATEDYPDLESWYKPIVVTDPSYAPERQLSYKYDKEIDDYLVEAYNNLTASKGI